MAEANEGRQSRKAIIVILVLILIGASIYFGYYLGKEEAKTEIYKSNIEDQSLKPQPRYPASNYSSILLITSPDGNAEDRIVELIGAANRSIDVEMYSFTNLDIANALIEAKKKGVYVRVILDYTQSGIESSKQIILSSGGIDIKKAPSNFKITHSKVMIIDGTIVLIGSHNWSLNAMFYNRELSIVINSSSLAAQLEEIFDSDWSKSSNFD